jgi:hypothetical protein
MTNGANLTLRTSMGRRQNKLLWRLIIQKLQKFWSKRK